MSRLRKRSDPFSPGPLGARSALGAAALGLALSVLSGCGAGSSAFGAAAELPEDKRSPDGISLDPVSDPPPPTDRARAGDGLVVLRAPLGLDQALDLVDRAFELIVREDQSALVELFSGDAAFVASSGSPGAVPPPPRDVFRQRLYKLDYTLLAGETIYRPGEIEVYRGSDEVLPDWAAQPALGLASDDVVLRIPITTPKLGPTRYFGAQIELHLRRAGRVYRIYRWVEDFQVP